MIKINWQRNKNQIIGAVVILVLAGIAARILIWEHNYYESKEGTERAAIISTPSEDETIDETPITEAAVAEYNVAADRPRYLSVPKLGITNARVIPVGLSTAGQLQTPNNIYDVAWYTGSSKPGTGGTMLLNGHNGGPTKTGVFKHLGDLVEGDIITVERGDGAIFNYSVVENLVFSLQEANQQMNRMLTTPETGKESISVITCTGEWSQVQRTYLSRQFLRAVLVVE